MDKKISDEQGSLFPELDNTNPDHKALIKLAKDFNRKKMAHLDGIATLKESRDTAEQKLLMKLHDLKMTGFIYDGLHVKTQIGVEKVVVKVEDGQQDGDEDEEGAEK